MKTALTSTLFESLICSRCKTHYPKTAINTFSPCCNQPLLANYQLEHFSFEEIVDQQQSSLWRYSSLLPVIDQKNIVSLHEGMTPLVSLDHLSMKNECAIFMKDESYNSTGSFKARGMSVAVSKAKELGLNRLITATAGNAGGALAAYCAKAKIHCKVIMPEHTPDIFKDECRWYGAELVLVKGLINDCAKELESIKTKENYFDVSTMKEPYRLEGKKTMGYELAEQLNWQLPDVIVYPAGGGTGLVGIWKALHEMLQLGWIEEPLPKMFAVQSENCAAINAAVKSPDHWKENFTPHPSIAHGLAVPYPFGMQLMLEVINASGGGVTTVSENEIKQGIKEVAKEEGVLLSAEGSAAWMGTKRLIAEKKILKDERVLFLNTGSGYKNFKF